MKKKDWKAVQKARAVLCLGESATLSEIKQAYHQQCKRCHPDHGGDEKDTQLMYALTEAYEVLMQYCTAFRFPLEPPEGETDMYDPEDWWMTRFGQDFFWGKKSR